MEKDEIKELNKRFEEVLGTEKITKDPKYVYYVNKEGKMARKKKGGLRRRRPTQKVSEVDMTIPKWLLKGYILENRRVCKFGTSGAIYVPRCYVNRVFKLILLPIDDVTIEDKEVKLF